MCIIRCTYLGPNGFVRQYAVCTYLCSLSDSVGNVFEFHVRAFGRFFARFPFTHASIWTIRDRLQVSHVEHQRRQQQQQYQIDQRRHFLHQILLLLFFVSFNYFPCVFEKRGNFSSPLITMRMRTSKSFQPKLAILHYYAVIFALSVHSVQRVEDMIHFGKFF